MRKIFTAFITLSLFFVLGVTAYAQASVSFTTGSPGSDGEDVTVVDWGADNTAKSNAQDDYGTGSGSSSAAPVRDVTAELLPQSIEAVTENGVRVVKKTYEVTTDFDPQTLVEAFSQDEYSFTCREILKRELPGETLTRKTTKTALTESDTDNEAKNMKHFPDAIDYEEDGYTGQLYLDSSTFKTEANAYKTYPYSYTKTREVPGLERNDPAYIEKEWNGMILTGVSFKQGADGRYTAYASYKGTATGKRASGFVTTAIYRGEITKTDSGNILYTVIYEGEPDEAEQPVQAEPDTTEPVDGDADEQAAEDKTTPEDSPKPSGVPAAKSERLNVEVIVVCIIFLFGAVFIPIYLTKQQRKERKENLEAFEEIKRFIRGED